MKLIRIKDTGKGDVACYFLGQRLRSLLPEIYFVVVEKRGHDNYLSFPCLIGMKLIQMRYTGKVYGPINVLVTGQGYFFKKYKKKKEEFVPIWLLDFPCTVRSLFSK